MANDELLRYIAEHMATKDELKDLEAKMTTRDDLRETENMILTEMDRIQERSEEHYEDLSTRIRDVEYLKDKIS